LRDFHTLLYTAVDDGMVAPSRHKERVKGLIPEGDSLAVTDPLLDEPVVVTDRDPSWFTRATAERDVLLHLAGDHVAVVEHIGGTAVPAVAGRPVVDLLLGVESLPVSRELREILEKIGYEDCGDGGTRGRSYFRKRSGARFDVHIVEHAGPLWEQPIALREHLADNPAEAARLAHAKREAAKACPWSALGYAEERGSAFAKALANLAHAAAYPASGGSLSSG
jgi:GrpB-like predicted nucleotidyltransferase (UPF0157 family)